MFWECHVITSSIDKLLDQPWETVQLQDLLDENDLIQECLMQNQRLMDYLIQPRIMNELISHIIVCPADDQFRYAHAASELLSGNFHGIQEALLDKNHLDRLYSFLLVNEQLTTTTTTTTTAMLTINPILASYFSRVIMTLIIRRPVELLNYFKSRSTFKNDFLSHLYSTSIADVLYRLIADCAEQRAEVLQWYEEIHLIDDLLQQLCVTDSVCMRTNIFNLLGEFLRLTFDQYNEMNHNDQGNSNISIVSCSMAIQSTMVCFSYKKELILSNAKHMLSSNRIYSSSMKFELDKTTTIRST
jgi:hypothetical protein